MFGNVRVTCGPVLENFRKSSESGRITSENRQERRHQYVYVTKTTLHVSSKIWILFLPPCNILYLFVQSILPFTYFYTRVEETLIYQVEGRMDKE